MVERLEDAIPADRLSRSRVLRMRLVLNQRPGIPDEMIAPRALGRLRDSVNDRPIDAFGFVASKLILQRLLPSRMLCKDDKP